MVNIDPKAVTAKARAAFYKALDDASYSTA
jgi:hypothetical protein